MSVIRFIKDAFVFLLQMLFDFTMGLLALAIVVCALVMVAYIVKVTYEELKNG